MAKRRPISRKFWNLLKYLPERLQAGVIRSQFEVDYDLPSEVTLKQAETPEEIAEALKIVHDSYVELGYIDPHPAGMRFNKFLALPTTVFLIAKWKDQVIGTMAIITDSALRLPIEQSWDISGLRSAGKIVAEISSLCIVKSFKMRRGKLLLPLCKLMYEFCTQIMHIDTLVISTTQEVEAFYTQVLLFDSARNKKGDPNSLVKGNPSCFCYLHLNKETVDSYRRVYNRYSENRNLYRFMVEFRSPNIILPQKKKSIHGYLQKKNIALQTLLNIHKVLDKDFAHEDQRVIQNLRVSLGEPQVTPINERRKKRIEVREKAWVFSGSMAKPLEAKILNISLEGLQIKLNEAIVPETQSLTSETMTIVIYFDSGHITLKAHVQWVRDAYRLGCKVLDSSNPEWQAYIDDVWSELGAIEYHQGAELKAS